MSFLIHITDSLNGHFSKSRDIVAHNGALRSKFAFFTSSTVPSPLPPFSSPSPLARDCNIPHGCWTWRTTWHTRVYDKKGSGRGRTGPPFLSHSSRRRRARNSFFAAPVGLVTFRIYRPEAGSTTNPFAAIRSTYEEFIRAEASRVCRHAHLRPSFRILFLPLSFAAICSLVADLSVDFCFLACVLSHRTSLETCFLPFSFSFHRSMDI